MLQYSRINSRLTDRAALIWAVRIRDFTSSRNLAYPAGNPARDGFRTCRSGCAGFDGLGFAGCLLILSLTTSIRPTQSRDSHSSHLREDDSPATIMPDIGGRDKGRRQWFQGVPSGQPTIAHRFNGGDRGPLGLKAPQGRKRAGCSEHGAYASQDRLKAGLRTERGLQTGGDFSEPIPLI